MDFMFEWQQRCLTSERSERVKIVDAQCCKVPKVSLGSLPRPSQLTCMCKLTQLRYHTL